MVYHPNIISYLITQQQLRILCYNYRKKSCFIRQNTKNEEITTIMESITQLSKLLFKLYVV